MSGRSGNGSNPYVPPGPSDSSTSALANSGLPDRWFILSLLAVNYFTLYLHRMRCVSWPVEEFAGPESSLACRANVARLKAIPTLAPSFCTCGRSSTACPVPFLALESLEGPWDLRRACLSIFRRLCLSTAIFSSL